MDPAHNKMSLGYHCFQVPCCFFSFFSGVQNKRHLGTVDACRFEDIAGDRDGGVD